MTFIGRLVATFSLLFASTAYAIPQLDIDVDTGQTGVQMSRVVTVGTVFDVEIQITGASGLFAYDIDVDHNPSVLDATGVTEGPFLGTAGATFFQSDDSGNPVNAISTLLSVATGVSGDGTLFTIQYTALVKGDISLQFTFVDLADDQFSPISVEVGGSRIVVQGVSLPSTLLLLSLGLAAIAGARPSRRRCAPPQGERKSDRTA